MPGDRVLHPARKNSTNFRWTISRMGPNRPIPCTARPIPLQNARNSVFAFTRDEITDAFIAAKNRGVAIRILADSSQANGTGSDIPRLEAAGIQVKRTSGGGGGILH